jgi:hypothetical protein
MRRIRCPLRHTSKATLVLVSTAKRKIHQKTKDHDDPGGFIASAVGRSMFESRQGTSFLSENIAMPVIEIDTKK